jgi:hypothetical protein
MHAPDEGNKAFARDRRAVDRIVQDRYPEYSRKSRHYAYDKLATPNVSLIVKISLDVIERQ